MHMHWSNVLFWNAHLLRHRSEHTSPSAIYYQMDSVTKAMHYKAKHVINLKHDPNLFRCKKPDLTIESSHTIDTAMCTRTQTISSRIHHIHSNLQNRVLWMVFFSQTTLLYSEIVVILWQFNSNNWFICYLLCVQKNSSWLCKSVPSVSIKLGVEQTLLLLTSDILSYDTAGLNAKIPDKPLSSFILNKDSRNSDGELKWALTYMF